MFWQKGFTQSVTSLHRVLNSIAMSLSTARFYYLMWQFLQNSLYAVDCKRTFMTAIRQPMIPSSPHSVNCPMPNISDMLIPKLAPLGRDKHEQQS